jgi:FemAB-related protein (PEP-CTERM system-associated)
MTIVKRLDAVARPAWDRFVLDICPEASFFHLSGWQTVIEGGFGQHCHFLYAERDGQICGVLPLVHVRSRLFGDRLISNGFTVGGGVAALDDEARASLDAEALRLMAELGVDSLEYRRSGAHPDDPRWRIQTGIYANFSRPIAEDEASCLSQIPRKQRAVLRKAIENGGLEAAVERSPDRFLPLYRRTMRDHGTPVFGTRYFGLLMAEFDARADCQTIYHQGEPISSVLNFYFRDAVLPYYTGCQPQARKLGANDFMYWQVMRRARAAGFTRFDFGRSKLGTGPYAYKHNWGFEPEPIVHEFVMAPGKAPPDLTPKNPKFQLFIALWRRLPLPVAALLGPPIVREIG